MAIEIQVVGQGEEFGFRGPLYAPIILCDHCGQRINSAAEGAYVWGVRFASEGGETFTPIRFFHKGKNAGAPGARQSCALAWDRFEQEIERQGYHRQWLELEDFVVYLANNLPGGAERKKRMLAASKTRPGDAPMSSSIAEMAASARTYSR